MKNQDWYDLGNKIQEIVQDAVNSKNYEKLSQTINQTVNKAIDSGGDALKSAWGNLGDQVRAKTQEKKEHAYQNPSFQGTKEKPKRLPALYARTSGESVKGMMMTITGGILLSGMSIGLLVALLWRALGHVNGMWLPVILFMTAFDAAGAVLTVAGVKKIGFLNRFRRYIGVIGDKTYCELEKLSMESGKPVKFIRKDLRKMMEKGWFLQGHMDKQETCLITSNEMYEQYLELQRNLEQRKQEANPTISTEGAANEEVQSVLDKGNEYLKKIRASNDAIPGEEISRKISRMELIVQKIFLRAKEHPEVIPDLKRMMDYYLPMTVKLLDAYEEMDSQPIQGENIRNSKIEIEKTLNTLNLAFENLLDSIFKNTAWDVSSDISVLNTILAQEGLTGGGEFKGAGQKR